MPRGFKIGLTVSASCIVVLLLFILHDAGRVPRFPPLPKPNGYDDFLKAAALIAGDPASASALSSDDLRKFISTNAESLRLVHLGLTRACSVPTEAAMTNFSLILSDSSGLKSLATLLVEEGRLAQLEERPMDAARSYLDAIRYGNELSRGGFLINRLLGLACEARGGNRLTALIPSMSCEHARSIIAGLEKLDAERVTWEEVLSNEKCYARQAAPNPVHRIASWWLMRAALQKGEQKHARAVARTRLLAVEMALRCYRADKGTAPDRLEHLVPGLLARIPLDPFSNGPLVYRPQGTNWLLYSLGPDRVDNGGTPLASSTPGSVPTGDLLFDSTW